VIKLNLIFISSIAVLILLFYVNQRTHSILRSEWALTLSLVWSWRKVRIWWTYLTSLLVVVLESLGWRWSPSTGLPTMLIVLILAKMWSCITGIGTGTTKLLQSRSWQLFRHCITILLRILMFRCPTLKSLLRHILFHSLMSSVLISILHVYWCLLLGLWKSTGVIRLFYWRWPILTKTNLLF